MHGETLLEVATMPDAVHGQLDRDVRHPATRARRTNDDNAERTNARRG